MKNEHRSSKTPVHIQIASGLMSPASLVYGAAVNRRNRRFDAGIGVHSLEVPVISVGNITMGGTGKTPICRKVLEILRESGHQPALAMRGYRASRTGGSDEAAEYVDAFKNLPLAVGADRVAALAELATTEKFDCVVLDDGFQHRRIARDLDLVLIDSTRPGLDGRLIPAGRLREPVEALSRADAVIVTRSESVDHSLAERIKTLSGKSPIAWFNHVWDGVDIHLRGETQCKEVEYLQGLRLGVSLGVGNPRSIRENVVAAGAQIIFDAAARDHHRYTGEGVKKLRARIEERGGEALFVTPKDWVSIRRCPEGLGSLPVIVPRLRVEPVSGAQDFSSLVASVFEGE